MTTFNRIAVYLFGFFAIALGLWSFQTEAPRQFIPVSDPTPYTVGVAVDLTTSVGSASVSDLEQKTGVDFLVVSEEYGLYEARTTNPEALERMLLDEFGGSIETIEPIIEMTLFDSREESIPATPNDPGFEKQWHMRAMGAPSGWTNTPAGKGVVVAVLDTGVAQVSDLKGTEFKQGKSFIDGEPTTEDFQGHGTHVAGTVAQTTNNEHGYTGVAPHATIMPVKVLSRTGSGSNTGVAAGIRWAADNGADIITMSLGSHHPSEMIDEACEYAHSKGVLVVAAAGNSGREGVGWPGASPGVIGVSATGPDSIIAPYSSWGKGVDIAAPGGNKQIAGGGVWQQTIQSAGGMQAEYQGTSMATPHVAGAAAVIISTGMTPHEAEKVLLDSAKGEDWDPKYGYGHLDLVSALGTTSYGVQGTIELLLTSLALGFLALTGQGTSTRYRVRSIVGTILLANGVFFLPFLPFGIPDQILFISDGVLSWPGYLLGDLGRNPLWMSALFPVGLTFLFAPSNKLRWLVAAVACAWSAELLYGAASNTITVAYLPEWLGRAWMLTNGVVATLCTLSCSGLEIVENRDQK